MPYNYSNLIVQCRAQGWLSTDAKADNYVTPQEWSGIVNSATIAHVGRPAYGRYVAKAIRKIALRRFSGSTLKPLQSRIANCVNPKIKARKKERAAAIERARVAALAAAKQRKQEIAKLRTDLAAAQKAVTDTQQKLDTCTTQLAACRAEVGKLTKALEAERESKEALEERADLLGSQLEAAKGDVLQITRAFGQAMAEVRQLRANQKQAEEALKAANAKLDTVLAEQQKHRTALDAVQAAQRRTNVLLARLVGA